MGKKDRYLAPEQQYHRLNVYSSQEPHTALKQHTIQLGKDAESMILNISDLWDRGSRVRVIAREANRTFLEMQQKLACYHDIFDQFKNKTLTTRMSTSCVGVEDRSKTELCEPEQPSTSTHKDKTVLSIHEDSEYPSVKDFQRTKQSLNGLQLLAEEWLIRSDGEYPSVERLKESSSNSRDICIVFGDKQYPKNLLKTVKQMQHRVYQFVPKWARGLIYPEGKDGRKLPAENDSLDGLQCLNLGQEVKGIAGEDLFEDRILVNGMESLRTWINESEEKEECNEELEAILGIFKDDEYNSTYQ